MSGDKKITSSTQRKNEGSPGNITGNLVERAHSLLRTTFERGRNAWGHARETVRESGRSLDRWSHARYPWLNQHNHAQPEESPTLASSFSTAEQTQRLPHSAPQPRSWFGFGLPPHGINRPPFHSTWRRDNFIGRNTLQPWWRQGWVKQNEAPQEPQEPAPAAAPPREEPQEPEPIKENLLAPWHPTTFIILPPVILFDPDAARRDRRIQPSIEVLPDEDNVPAERGQSEQRPVEEVEEFAEDPWLAHLGKMFGSTPFSYYGIANGHIHKVTAEVELRARYTEEQLSNMVVDIDAVPENVEQAFMIIDYLLRDVKPLAAVAAGSPPSPNKEFDLEGAIAELTKLEQDAILERETSALLAYLDTYERELDAMTAGDQNPEAEQLDQTDIPGNGPAAASVAIEVQEGSGPALADKSAVANEEEAPLIIPEGEFAPFAAPADKENQQAMLGRYVRDKQNFAEGVVSKLGTRKHQQLPPRIIREAIEKAWYNKTGNDFPADLQYHVESFELVRKELQAILRNHEVLLPRSLNNYVEFAAGKFLEQDSITIQCDTRSNKAWLETSPNRDLVHATLNVVHEAALDHVRKHSNGLIRE